MKITRFHLKLRRSKTQGVVMNLMQIAQKTPPHNMLPHRDKKNATPLGIAY